MWISSQIVSHFVLEFLLSVFSLFNLFTAAQEGGSARQEGAAASHSFSRDRSERLSIFVTRLVWALVPVADGPTAALMRIMALPHKTSVWATF